MHYKLYKVKQDEQNNKIDEDNIFKRLWISFRIPTGRCTNGQRRIDPRIKGGGGESHKWHEVETQSR